MKTLHMSRIFEKPLNPIHMTCNLHFHLWKNNSTSQRSSLTEIYQSFFSCLQADGTFLCPHNIYLFIYLSIFSLILRRGSMIWKTSCTSRWPRTDVQVGTSKCSRISMWTPGCYGYCTTLYWPVSSSLLLCVQEAASGVVLQTNWTSLWWGWSWTVWR